MLDRLDDAFSSGHVADAPVIGTSIEQLIGFAKEAEERGDVNAAAAVYAVRYDWFQLCRGAVNTLVFLAHRI